MSWRDIIRKEEKAHCGTEKLDDEELKAAKPDFLDLDKDGDKEESMKKAAKDKKEKEVKEADDKPKYAGNKTEPMKEAAKDKKHDDTEKKAFKEHKMYKDGKVVTAKTHADHVKYSKMGYTHEKPKSKKPFTRKD